MLRSTKANINDENESGKRSTSDNFRPPVSSMDPVYFKLLVPDNVAGIIIGKSGESIVKLQKRCRCRILFSQPRDFYLGTSDRVCVLQGESYEVIYVAVCLILKQWFSTVEVSLAYFRAISSVFEAQILTTLNHISILLGYPCERKSCCNTLIFNWK